MATPNEFQLKQMQSMVAKGGGISDHYKNLFGASYTPPNPTAAPSTNTTTPSYSAGGSSSGSGGASYSTNTGGNANFNPQYGANISNFDANNQQHIALADAGQQWAAANRAGDTAAMAAAKALGDQIRSGVSGASYNAPTGVSTLPVAQQQQPRSNGYTAPNAPYMQLTPDQIQSEASYQINKERSDLKNTVDHMIAGVKNNANYANQNIADQRVLEDAAFNRSVSTFSGKKGYLQNQLMRGRQIDDTYRAANLENELTRIQTDLYNFDKLAPDKQRTLMNEMTRMERDYGLQVGQLTGWFNGQRTLAGEQFDWSKDPSNPAVVGQNISNQIGQIQLDSLPQQTQLELQQLEQRAKQGEIDLRTAEYQLKELTDPNSITNQAKAIELQMAQLEAKNLPEQQRLELQKLRKQITDIGKTPYRSAEEIEYDKQKVNLIKAQIAEIENAPPKATDISAKDSADNYSEAKELIDGYSRADAKAYVQGIRGYLTDADYKALIKYIDDEL